VDDAYQFLGGQPSWIILVRPRVNQMFADMIFDDFGDEPVHGAATGRRLLEHLRTLLLALDRALNRLDLAAYPFEPVQELGSLVGDVAHFIGFAS
jgi:hypothetical protein